MKDVDWEAWRTKLSQCLEDEEPLGEGHVLGLLNDLTRMSEVVVGDVVQITPHEDEHFGACFMVVEEVKSWGFRGYCEVPGPMGGKAYYRVPSDRCERVGKAVWLSE